MNIADRIQHLRKTKGISQEELADKLGISRQAVSKWESEQSIPDMDKIIAMSDYFEVTTDYLLKGIEPINLKEKSDNAIIGQILYVVSTTFIVIGLTIIFANWIENQKVSDLWGSMIIQVVGVAAYFIAKLMLAEKSPFYIKFFNVVLALFVPISMVTGFLSITFFKQGWVAPYPIGFWHTIIFALAYLITCVTTFIILRRHK